MDIQNIIDKYGATIASQLQIATTQVYEKVLWYVQLSGVVQLSQFLLISLIFGIANFIYIRKFQKIYKTTKGDYAKNDTLQAGIFAGVIGNFILFVLLLLITDVLTTSIVKIVAPQYWIIEQIINKTTQ